MKPFNLEEAKAGKPVVTRDGKPVRILAFDKKGIYFIAALVDVGGYEEIAEYNESGTVSDDYDDDYDLFMKAEKKEGWINLFRDIDGIVFPSVIFTNEDNSKPKISPVGDYITTVKVEWEE